MSHSALHWEWRLLPADVQVAAQEIRILFIMLDCVLEFSFADLAIQGCFSEEVHVVIFTVSSGILRRLTYSCVICQSRVKSDRWLRDSPGVLLYWRFNQMGRSPGRRRPSRNKTLLSYFPPPISERLLNSQVLEGRALCCYKRRLEV